MWKSGNINFDNCWSYSLQENDGKPSWILEVTGMAKTSLQVQRTEIVNIDKNSPTLPTVEYTNV